MSRERRGKMLFLLFYGCTETPDASGTRDDTATDTGTTPEWSPPEGGVIELVTRDGVTLAADYYPAPSQDRGAVVLIHMHPPGGFTRADWPQELVAAYGAEGLTVLAFDRRGAGDSDGDPNDAWFGEWGRYDVESAVLRATRDGYEDVQLVGASNGTASMIDYAAWAEGEDLPVPTTLAFLTGGTYTETNTAMAAVPILPSSFIYGDAEDAWSESVATSAPSAWSFHEIADGAHGTEMFDGPEAEQVIELLSDFAADQAQP
jgi:pimeloyl-ACP methyl ester carboxylesterase